MINTQYGNYVKFIRGTEASWKNIPNEQKSSDTLYFISDTGSATGKLYLGAKLISNGALSSATSLSQLNDVLIKEGITDQSILVYNATEEKWENKSILDIFIGMSEVFKAADEENDGAAGLVPAPVAGQQNLFLRGDATWADPISGVMTEIEELQTQLEVIIGEDLDKSMREVAAAEASAAVATIIAQAPEQFDTLKEIADWIQSNQGSVDVAGLTTRVSDLEEIIYGVEADEENNVEEVLGLQTIVSTLQTEVSGLQNVVSTLQEDLDAVESVVESHTTDITAIKEALRWQDIVEE